jgi:hypothetical protein
MKKRSSLLFKSVESFSTEPPKAVLTEPLKVLHGAAQGSSWSRSGFFMEPLRAVLTEPIRVLYRAAQGFLLEPLRVAPRSGTGNNRVLARF